MSTLIFIIVVLVVLALVLYAIDLLPLPKPPIKVILQCLAVIVAIIVILQRTGLVR